MDLDLGVLKWDHRFLDMAKLVSKWSKDPSTQVGAVIVDPDRRVVSLGYNGFPVGVSDDFRLDNRKTKYKMVVHAESNALLFSSTNVSNCAIYTYPFMPCARCAGMIIQSGINKVVSYKTNTIRWAQEFETSRDMFAESEVALTEYTDKELAKNLR